MKVRVMLSGEDNCSTIVECTFEEYKLLKKIEDTMGSEENNPYCPSMYVEEVGE